MAGKITEIKGITVGHYTDMQARTGCTAVMFKGGAVGGVDVRGCAPGTRETDLLRGYNLVERINAIMLSGGSAYGLDSASGAMQYLEEQGIGYGKGDEIVPIVPAAVIFDLGVGSAKVRPGKTEGYMACTNAKESFETGAVGAGTGATFGKAFGIGNAVQGGVGTSCINLPSDVKVGAIVVVNALGDVYDPDTGAILAGGKLDGRLTPCLGAILPEGMGHNNTTVGIVATNATLTREQANKLASIAHDGYAQAIRPVHTPFDGDTIFAASTCELPPCDMLPLFAAATRAMALAILSSAGFDK